MDEIPQTHVFVSPTYTVYKITSPTNDGDILFNLDNRSLSVSGQKNFCLWLRSGEHKFQTSTEQNRFGDNQKEFGEEPSRGNSIGKYFGECFNPADLTPFIIKVYMVWDKLYKQFISTGKYPLKFEFEEIVREVFKKRDGQTKII